MGPLLRPITDTDLPAVLGWNAAHVELLSPLDQVRLAELLAAADTAAVIESQGHDAGFVLTFAAGAAYDSVNYRWFADRHPDFVYLDRIVVDPAVRRTGVASLVYDALENDAATRAPVLCLEVNIDPPNEASLAFHRSRGFVEVGRQLAGGHLVALFEKPLG